MKFGFSWITEEAKDKLVSLNVPYRQEDSQWSVTLQENEDEHGTRVWLDPEIFIYYYLIRGTIFTMKPDRFSDNSTDPPTIIEKASNLSLGDQDLYRGVLEDERPPVIWRPI